MGNQMMMSSPWQALYRPSLSKDLAGVVVVVLLVFISLPVSVVGDESLVSYFLSDRKTQIVSVDNDCLAMGSPCVVRLSDSSELTVTMAAEVNVMEAFDVLADVEGLKAEQIIVRFEGLDHSHGLLPQSMRQINPQSFDVEGLLSYCGYPKMNWVAVISVYTERIIYEASFRFVSFDVSAQPDVELALRGE